MAGRHAIETALDLARMPALARAKVAPPIPADVIEIIRIAAADQQACAAAVARTGERSEIIIEAARFYLQQVLFRPDADCYRVLGIERSDSRLKARSHMRWLMQWLHPDCNDGLDAIYAERVLTAWQQVSGKIPVVENPPARADSARTSRLKPREFAGVRLPWIRRPDAPAGQSGRAYRLFGLWVMPVACVAAGMAIALWFVVSVYSPEQTAAMTPLR